MSQSRHAGVSRHPDVADELDPDLRRDDRKKILSITSLSLSYFRNYESARLELTSAPIVLTGPNGAGKTNILEAVSLLTPGRGLRRASLSEMDDRYVPGSYWAVAAQVDGIRGEVAIGTGRDPETPEGQPERRIVHIDGKPGKSHAVLSHHLSMIWLTPQMEQLFNEGTSAGRKFLDRLVYSFESEHATRINEYEYAMRERNRLLQTGSSDPIWLDSLEQAMAETGAAIAQARLETIDRINHAMERSTLSFPKARLAIDGLVENQFASGQTALQVEQILKKTWEEGRRQDAAAGRTLAGPHRSRMLATHAEKHMPAESCSTGEQKAMLLSISLAQAHAGTLWKGLLPVVLLDEIIAHLDATKRLELFEEICQIGAQIWMTGTDEKMFADLKEKAQYFRVENGVIFPGKAGI